MILSTHTSMHETALIVVDVQNGFLPGGNLAVAEGEKIIPVINRMAYLFPNIIITQDWHPAGHMSFASSHADKQPYDEIETSYGPQVLWPEHCVQGSEDAELATELKLPRAQMIIRKGFHPKTDSYSAFKEADGKTLTGLASYLKERNIITCYICGLATDFCVAYTALDAVSAGFKAIVIEDACRGIDLDSSLDKAWQQMTEAGVHRIQSSDLH